MPWLFNTPPSPCYRQPPSGLLRSSAGMIKSLSSTADYAIRFHRSAGHRVMDVNDLQSRFARSRPWLAIFILLKHGIADSNAACDNYLVPAIVVIGTRYGKFTVITPRRAPTCPMPTIRERL
jgi:hypothetical protein